MKIAETKKTAVIFPGVGYTKDRPLLYYSGKIAASAGYDLKFIDFSGLDWSKDKLRDKSFLAETMEKCMDMTEAALKDVSDLSGAVFISKSIGTAVATCYARRKSLDVTQICFSPLELIADHVYEGGAVLFCGDDDPYADYAALERIAEEKKLEMHRIAGGNHSLETGDVFTDIKNLEEMMRRVACICRRVGRKETLQGRIYGVRG